MKQATKPVGKWFISLLAFFTIVSPYLADWNETHIYNPRWTGHAKFHNAQTMMLGALLGAVALWFLWRKSQDPLLALQAGTLLATLYWLAQIGASFFPGIAFIDPEFLAQAPRIGGMIPNQRQMSLVFVVLVAGAYWMEKKRLERQASPKRDDATNSWLERVIQ